MSPPRQWYDFMKRPWARRSVLVIALPLYIAWGVILGVIVAADEWRDDW